MHNLFLDVHFFMNQTLSYILLCAIVIGVFFSLMTARAVANDNSASTPCHTSLHQKYGTSVDPFFQALQEGNNETAYQMTSQGLKKNIPLAAFQEFVAKTGINTFLEKKWFYFEKVKPGIVSIAGDFSLGNHQSRTIKLVLVLEDNSEMWKIDTITAVPSSEKLRASFPSGEKLKKMIFKEINDLVKTSASREYKSYYRKHFAKKSQKTVTLDDLIAALTSMDEQNLSISLASKDDLTLNECTPGTNSEGAITVNGAYKNEASVISFEFDYMRDRGWKLSGFDIQSKPKTLKPPEMQFLK